MKPQWKIENVIDLEYFIRQDLEVDEDFLDQRDRSIFKQDIASPLASDSKNVLSENRWVIYQWLKIRRSIEKKKSGQAFFPGQAYADIFRLFKIIIALSGAVLGGGLAAAFLKYSGVDPVNVAFYLGVLVLPQILLAIGMLFVLGYDFARPSKIIRSPLYVWMGQLLARGMARVAKPIQQKFTADHRQTLDTIRDLVKLKNKLYGKLFFWPIFILFQIFGVALNMGILAGTLMRVLGTDLAFGWQTTLKLAPSAVYKLVQILSIPWQWAIPDHLAHPGLEQIIGSRIILKEGIHSLATQDLVSWWPFLCFCILFYGIIPRGIFLVLGVFAEKRLLNKLSFMQADCQRLMLRMTTPILKSSGSPSGDKPLPPEKADEEEMDAMGAADADPPSCIALIPEDICQHCDTDALACHFKKGLVPGNMVSRTITMDMDADEEKLDMLSDGSLTGKTRVFLLMEAWQPPIREMLTFLRQLRLKLPHQVLIVVGLVGKPDGQDIFTEVDDVDFRVWKEKIASLHDPYILLERAKPL